MEKIRKLNKYIKFRPGIFNDKNTEKLASIISDLLEKSDEQTETINKLIDELNNAKEKDEKPKFSEKELFEKSARLIVEEQNGSISLLQRRLNLNYNTALNVMDKLEKEGIVGEFTGVKFREVNFKTLETLNKFLSTLP